MGEPANQHANAAFGDHDGDVGRSYGFAHKGSKVAVVRHLKQSREHVAGDLDSLVLRPRHRRVQTHGRDDRRDNAAEGPAKKSRQSR
jgi:hypothetical protein